MQTSPEIETILRRLDQLERIVKKVEHRLSMMSMDLDIDDKTKKSIRALRDDLRG